MRRFPLLSGFAVVNVSVFLGALGGCAHTPASDTSQASSSSASVASPTPPAAPVAVAAQAATPAPHFTPLPGYARPPKAELEARLTPLQFEVTQHAATEPPFRNAYFDNHAEGIYVDSATGEPLFSSADKFESGTGWPSFVRPIEDGHVVQHTDETFGMTRTEVVSQGGGSHLGHVFDDGPAPTHMRYCINSASLRFIPANQLVAEGYGKFASRFASGATADVIPPSTDNACALPPPGTTAGCSATLESAVFARADGDDRAAHTPGVLEVNAGFEGDRAAVEVTYDPAKLTYDALLAAWTKGRETQTLVYAHDDAQKKAASAHGLKTLAATPFRRATM